MHHLGLLERIPSFKVDKTSQAPHCGQRKKRLSPLHPYADLSVANVVSWVNTNPDNFQIPPADDFLHAQTNTHSVFKLNVCSVYLDREGQGIEWSYLCIYTHFHTKAKHMNGLNF